MRHLKHGFLTIKHGFLTIKKNSSKSVVSSKLVNQSMLLFFLCKLRTALSNNQAFLFEVCERTIANYISLAREDLYKNLVPKFINYNDR